jgi:hypothetical protein
MNRIATPMTTTAAEGLPQRCFTVSELEQMVAAGILHEDERIELIGGGSIGFRFHERRRVFGPAAIAKVQGAGVRPGQVFDRH